MSTLRIPEADLALSALVRERYWLPFYPDKHKPGAWQMLDMHYSEPQRHYHGWNHIYDLHHKLDQLLPMTKRPDLIGTAIFWHDAVYRTLEKDGTLRPDYKNVQDSAALFEEYTGYRYQEPSAADAVHAMIMATTGHMKAKPQWHYYDGFADDFNLFIDLDLSSLGGSWNDFCRMTEQIRSEYSWVPTKTFCSRRAEILRDFAQEGVRLFRHDKTQFMWGERARENLLRSIAELEYQAATAPAPP